MLVDFAPAGIISLDGSLRSVIPSGIGWEDDGRTEKSQSWRIFEQFDHALEQATGAAAVDAAMVEA
jgi:hypothetical protein